MLNTGEVAAEERVLDITPVIQALGQIFNTFT